MTAVLGMMGLSRFGRHLRNCSAEVGDGGDPTEELLDVKECGFLNEVRSQMMSSIFEDDSKIFEVEGVPERRLHTDVGCPARKSQRGDSTRTQHTVDVGVEEAAVTRLGNDDVAGLRRQFVDQRVI